VVRSGQAKWGVCLGKLRLHLHHRLSACFYLRYDATVASLPYLVFRLSRILFGVGWAGRACAISMGWVVSGVFIQHPRVIAFAQKTSLFPTSSEACPSSLRYAFWVRFSALSPHRSFGLCTSHSGVARYLSLWTDTDRSQRPPRLSARGQWDHYFLFDEANEQCCIASIHTSSVVALGGLHCRILLCSDTLNISMRKLNCSTLYPGCPAPTQSLSPCHAVYVLVCTCVHSAV
jgi:hypothetical protein